MSTCSCSSNTTNPAVFVLVKSNYIYDFSIHFHNPPTSLGILIGRVVWCHPGGTSKVKESLYSSPSIKRCKEIISPFPMNSVAILPRTSFSSKGAYLGKRLSGYLILSTMRLINHTVIGFDVPFGDDDENLVVIGLTVANTKTREKKDEYT